VGVNKPTELILSRLRPYWLKHDCIAWDAASWSTGYAAWRKGLFYEGVIQVPDKKASGLERVAFMYREARKVMRQIFANQNACVFLEMGFDNSAKNFREEEKIKSISTGLLLGAVRGAIIGACDECVSFQEISNSAWKSTLGLRTRTGAEQKREAWATLCAWHGYEIDQTWCETKKEFTFDRSDAMGILTHAITTIDYKEEE